MDVGAVERVRPVEQVGVRRGPGDVSPALGVQGARRILEDSYTEGRKEQDRGIEEDAELVEENEEESEASSATVGKSSVNLIA